MIRSRFPSVPLAPAHKPSCLIVCASADVIARNNVVTSFIGTGDCRSNSNRHLFANRSIAGFSSPLLSASTVNPLISAASIRLCADRSKSNRL